VFLCLRLDIRWALISVEESMRILPFIFSTLVLYATSLRAQELDDIFDLSLEDLLDVEVTGSTLKANSQLDVPSAVTVFTFKQLEGMGLDSVQDLMNLVPGYQSYQSSIASGYRMFSVRGRRIGDMGASTLILLDGMRLEDAQSSGSLRAIPHIPLSVVERVEYIRGPGAAVYGSNAMMGVINIISRKDANLLNVSLGNLGKSSAHLQYSMAVKDLIVDVFGSYSKNTGDDYLLWDRHNQRMSMTQDPQEYLDLHLRLKWNRTQLGINHNTYRFKKYLINGTLSNEYNLRKAELSSVWLRQEFSLGDLENSYNKSGNAGRAQTTVAGALEAVSSPPSAEPMIILGETKGYEEIRVQWSGDWAIGSGDGLQFGAEYRHINAPQAYIDSNFNFGDLINRNFPIRSYPDLVENTVTATKTRRDILGLYGQYRWDITEDTSLTSGLRFDTFSSIGSQWSPRLALVHRLDEHNSLKLLFGEAFRAPSEFELNATNNGTYSGNPELVPETVKSWDLIWMGQWHKTGISLGYFENHFENAIQFRVVSGRFQIYDNLPLDPIKGVELEVSQQLNDNWLLRATYSRLTTKPDAMFREASDIGSVMLNFDHDRWNLNLIGSYAGTRENLMEDGSREKLDAYWVAHFKAVYQYSDSMRIFGQVKNLLDEDYLTPYSSASTQGSISNRGREWTVGVEWGF